MEEKLSNASIISFLKSIHFHTGIIDGLKIKYRSLICPFISLIKMVKPGEKVGDVGCGSGQFLLLLSKFAQPSYLFGIDIKQRLMKNATQLFSTIPKTKYNFSTYDGTNFPAELQEMDVIFLIDVLHHVPKEHQYSFLKNLIQVMKKGSRLILKDMNAKKPLVFFSKLHDIIFAGEIINVIAFEKAVSFLTQNGLQVIEQVKQTMFVYSHYTIVAQK
jgi:ubiquinone/menaquinone biosynthesis C-methylase UbiE